DRVVLLIINTAVEGTASAIDADGRVVAQERVPRSNTPHTLELRGPAIDHVLIEAPQGETSLVAICYHCAKQPRSQPISARALSGNVVLEEQPVAGAPGTVIGGSFTHDVITAVEFTGGNGALVDLCFDTVLRSVRSGGWELVPDCPQPIALPARHPAYPA